MSLGLLGIMLLNLGNNMQTNPRGAAIIALAALCWALGSVWSKHLPMPDGAMAGAAQMLGGGAVLSIISLAQGEALPTALPTVKAAWAMLLLVAFGSLVTYSAYLYLLKTVRPALATSYALVNPLVAMLLGSWLAGEKVGTYEFVALLSVMAAVLLLLSASAQR